MNKRTLPLFIITTMAIMLIGASNPQEPIGGRVSLYPGGETDSFPTGQPFHIMHGWSQIKDAPLGKFDFELYIGGSFRNEDFISRTVDHDGKPPSFVLLWVHNFPSGLTGDVEFTAKWYAPCQYAVEELGYGGVCTTPNEKVLTNSNTHTVTFE